MVCALCSASSTAGVGGDNRNCRLFKDSGLKEGIESLSRQIGIFCVFERGARLSGRTGNSGGSFSSTESSYSLEAKVLKSPSLKDGVETVQYS